MFMIPRFRPPFRLSDAIVLATPDRGDDLARFEAAFAALAGQRQAVLFPYGRTALMALVQALELTGGEVLCPAYTCVVVAHALVKSGCEPIFVDVGQDRNMDLEAAAQRVTPKTRALLATSLFGHPVDSTALEAFARTHPGVTILCDCAQGFFAGTGPDPVWRRGKAALFSLGLSKVLSTVGGGMVTTDEAALAKRLRIIASGLRPAGLAERLRRKMFFLASLGAFAEIPYALVNALERHGLLSGLAEYYRDDSIDLPGDHATALDAWQARLGLRQTARYHALAAARHEQFRFYRQALADLPGIVPPPAAKGASPSHFAVQTPNREQVMAEATRGGVQLGRVLEYAIPELSAYRNRPGNQGPYPVASQLARTMVNLPLGVTPGQAARVADVFVQAVVKAGDARWTPHA